MTAVTTDTAKDEKAVTAPARVLCALVALAAGIVGVAMLAAPGSTGSYFSWALAPPALAATVGAFYVASAIVFGWAAAREGWSGIRPLCVAVFGLTLPTLMATVAHRDLFDFDRWQAVAWVVLFVASAVLFAGVLLTNGRPTTERGPVLKAGTRTALASLAIVYGAVAIMLWTRPDLSSYGPLAAGGLGVRFIGSWAAFLAILAGLAATTPAWREARIALFALVLWPIAALVAAIAHGDELRSGLPAVSYVGGLSVLAGLAGLLTVLELTACLHDRSHCARHRVGPRRGLHVDAEQTELHSAELVTTGKQRC